MVRTHDDSSHPARLDSLQLHADTRADRRWSDDTPVAPVDETLVAYLDGELEEAERQALEDRLVSDASLRRRLSELQSGWEMLDQLPQASVSHDFARSTLELVAASTSQELEIQRRRKPWRLLGGMLIIAATTALLGWAGFAVVQWLQRARYEAQLADLPLAEHLDAYQLNADLDLMRALADDPRWNEAMELADDAGGLVVPEPLGLSELSLAARAEKIPRLDPELRRRLTGQWERLQLLDPAQLAEVRRNAAAIREQDQPEEILRTMKQYASWFESLPPEAQTRIVTAEDPKAVILEEVERSAEGWVRNYGLALGQSDREYIYEALKAIARQRLRWADQHDVWSDERLRFLRGFRDRAPQQDDSGGPSLNAEEALLLGWVYAPHRGGRGDRGERREPASSGAAAGENADRAGDDGAADGGAADGGAVDESTPPDADPWMVMYRPPTPEEMRSIEEVISNKAHLILQASGDSPAERQATLWQWCVAIIQSKAPSGNNPEIMLNRYLAMDPNEREVLDLKPPQQIFNELDDRRRGRPGGPRR